MKKLILGCTLILSGIIGGTGWLIAHACMQPNSFPSLIDSLTGSDGSVIVLFYVVALIGIILCITDAIDGKKK